MSKPAGPRKKCTGHNRAGEPCGYGAGFKTDHAGFGLCKFHGGNSPGGKTAAAREQAAELALQFLGTEIDTDPYEALLWMVRRTAGTVAYWSAQVADLNTTGVIVTHERTRTWCGTGENSNGSGEEVITTTSAELHIAVQAMHAAEERLVKFAKVAIDAGIAERQVRAAEQYGELFADAVRSILDGLGLSKKQLQAAPQLVERSFRVLEGGQVGVVAA